jgi:Mce-associated membrane protein
MTNTTKIDPADTDPEVEEGALATAPEIEEGALATDPQVEEGALATAPEVEEGALAPVTRPEDADAAPEVEEGALAPATRPEDADAATEVEEGALATAPEVEEGAPAPVTRPEDAEAPDDEPPEDDVRPRTRERGDSWPWALLAAGVVAVAIALFAWQDVQGATDPDRERADLRDSAIIEGTAAVETMNSMDHRDVAAGVEAWQSVTTGTLHDQLVAISPQERELLAQQGKVATGKVVQAALTDLTATTATIIAAVEVTVVDSESGEEPSVKRNRFSGDLVLVDGEWKLENLGQVPVNLQ